MAHYADLSPCRYVVPEGTDHILAVGWLEAGQEYSRGNVQPDFFQKLCELLRNPWEPVMCLGRHTCDLCQFGGGGVAEWNGFRITGRSGQILYVPSEQALFAAPSGIAHYIDSHGYCPPPEFQRAVMECPEMRSVAYFKKLKAVAGPAWLKAAGGA